MEKKRTIKDYFLISLKGIGMGAADVVPGVSGGTIAFITGIYEELINSIKSVNLSSIKALFGKKGIATFWQKINANFLLALLIGIFISVVSLAKLLEGLLENHPIQIWSFFFGLIVASAIYVGRKVDKWNVISVLFAVIGIVVAYFITTVTPAASTTDVPLWFVFISGAIAICAMILPGISGSFILLLLGQYKYILGAISEVKITVIAVFGAGAVIGLLSFSNILSWLLRKYHNATVALLTGFMIGSLNKVWPWKQAVETYTDRHGEVKPLVEKNVLPQIYEQVTGNNSELITGILLAVLGIVIVFAFEKLGHTFQNKEEEN